MSGVSGPDTCMRIEEFRSLVARIARDVPPEFRDGVVAIDVSPKTLPHPLRGDVYTLGECVPLEWSGSGADLHSRVILYHGSFACLARLGDFNWHEEAWDTLTHELRHHLEWRANVDALAAYDWAAEQNFARREGEPFERSWRLESIRWMTMCSSRGRGEQGAGSRGRSCGMGGGIACRLPAPAPRRCFLLWRACSTSPPATPSWS